MVAAAADVVTVVDVVILYCCVILSYILSFFLFFTDPQDLLLCFTLCVCRLVDRRSVGRWQWLTVHTASSRSREERRGKSRAL